jgi:hypothetical protein
LRLERLVAAQRAEGAVEAETGAAGCQSGLEVAGEGEPAMGVVVGAAVAALAAGRLAAAMSPAPLRFDVRPKHAVRSCLGVCGSSGRPK